ncbi:MAG: extracellular solute-binding protein [Spirochaetia bacterium]
MKKLSGIVWLLLLLILISCGGGAKRKLYLYNWTYFIPDETLEAFGKEFGIKVILDTYDGNETMYAKLATGNANFDIVVPSSDYVSIMMGQDMLAPIDKTKVPNFKNLDPIVLDFINQAGYDPGNQYSVPYFMGSTGINVNTAFVKDTGDSWRIFERSDLKDRMSMMNDMRDVLGGALKVLGYSGNSTNPQEIQQAKELIISKWKPNLLKFDSETFGKDFAARNTWAAQGYAEVVLNELEGNQSDYEFYIPKEGTMITLDSMTILKDAKNKDEAHELINYMLRPEVHAYVADMFYYPVIIPGAQQYRKNVPPYGISTLLERSELRKNIAESVRLYSEAWDEIFQGY